MNKYFVDECVDRRAVQTVPVHTKGFDVAFPEDRTYVGAKDAPIVKLAQTESRVLVTCDSDFSKSHVLPGDISEGVLWLHPARSSKKAITKLLAKFCRLRLEMFSANPYNFRGQIIEIENSGIHIVTKAGTDFHPWPPEYS
jgi:predicted nuclease of predicted toxin-antitoxin system